MNQSSFFADFFRDIKQQLGIDPDLDKYVQFLMLTQRYLTTDVATEFNWEKIYRVAEAMFLSRRQANDCDIFRKIFLSALKAESAACRSRVEALFAVADEKKDDVSPNKEVGEAEKPQDDTETDIQKVKTKTQKEVEDIQKEEKKPEEQANLSKKYINIDASAPELDGMTQNSDEGSQTTSEQPLPSKMFRMTDDYLPIMRRDMAQLWRVLRFQEKYGVSNELDIQGTVQRIAQDGLFLKPIYETGRRNREESLLIFADYRGSMTAFHRFTEGVIEAALGDGGHSKASVYYFQNCPLNHVFPRGSDFRKTVHLDTILNRANPNQTKRLPLSSAMRVRHVAIGMKTASIKPPIF